MGYWNISRTRFRIIILNVWLGRLCGVGGRGKRTTFTYRHGSKVTVLFYFRIKLTLHLCYYDITILKIIDGMNAPEHATYQLIRSSRAARHAHVCPSRQCYLCDHPPTIAMGKALAVSISARFVEGLQFL